MGTPDHANLERLAELLRRAGWTTSVRRFDVPGRTHWVVWCVKGGHRIDGRGDSEGAAWEAAYREASRMDAG